MNTIEEVRTSVEKAVECLIIGNRTFQAMDYLLDALGIIGAEKRAAFIGEMIGKHREQ